MGNDQPSPLSAALLCYLGGLLVLLQSFYRLQSLKLKEESCDNFVNLHCWITMSYSKWPILVHPWHASFNNAGGILLLYPVISCQARVSLTVETVDKKSSLFSGQNIPEPMSKDKHNKEGGWDPSKPPPPHTLLFQFCCKQEITGCAAVALKKISWWLSTGTCQIHFTKCRQLSHICSWSIRDWLDWMANF